MGAFKSVLAVAFITNIIAEGVAAAGGDAPINKVVHMMRDLVDKVASEKAEELAESSLFSQWCEKQLRSPSSGPYKVEQLKAEIMKSDIAIREFTSAIEELNENLERWENDKKSAAEVRSKEARDFSATSRDYTNSLDAMNRAISILKKQVDRNERIGLLQKSLLQVQKLALVPGPTRQALAAFLQHNRDPDEMLLREAPEAASYEFQSGGIIDILEKLMDEFDNKQAELEKEELNAQHAFNQIMHQLHDNIENAQHEIAEKTEARAKAQKAKALAKGDLDRSSRSNNEDHNYLDEVKALCAQKKADYQRRQNLRAEEIEAIKKAIDLVSSDTVKGAGERNLPSLLQKKHSMAFAQLRHSQQNPLQDKISGFLLRRAQVSGSKLLEQLSKRVAIDSFSKVKKMIRDLLDKLTQESSSDMEHRGWCDAEMASNERTRNRKTTEVSDLNADIEQLTIEIAELTQDISDLAVTIQSLNAAMQEATTDRATSKAKNTQTIKEARDAQDAIDASQAVVKDFYAKAAEATALIQQVQPLGEPDTFSKPYTGRIKEGMSVVTLLEGIQSDFVNLESETATLEAQEANEYEQYMFVGKRDKDVHETTMSQKSQRRTAQERALRAAQDELKLVQEELTKANAYFDKLKPTCVDVNLSFEERVKRRNEEIQSLKDALKILTGTDFA